MEINESTDNLIVEVDKKTIDEQQKLTKVHPEIFEMMKTNKGKKKKNKN